MENLDFLVKECNRLRRAVTRLRKLKGFNAPSVMVETETDKIHELLRSVYRELSLRAEGGSINAHFNIEDWN